MLWCKKFSLEFVPKKKSTLDKLSMIYAKYVIYIKFYLSQVQTQRPRNWKGRCKYAVVQLYHSANR